MKALLQYDWPGNVRELENCIERAVALGDQQMIDVNDLPPTIASAFSPAEPIALSKGESVSATDLEDIERATIERVTTPGPLRDRVLGGTFAELLSYRSARQG